MVSIYPTSLAAALPERTRRQAEDRLEKAGVRYVLSSWIDILGSPKTKPVPGFGNLCRGKGSRASPPISSPSTSSATPCTSSTPSISRTSGIASTS